MTNLTEAMRDLKVGESHAIVKRVAVQKYNVAVVQEDLLAMNRSVGAMANRVGGLTVERVNGLNASGTHIIYGLVVTRETK